jgi:hypothetical protein|eukprot:CAMPEP_0185580546 /NCGR_PEP_ID=MMETSP0434-20130131/16956_1 /TAXON_ID=626734 ORGANISM="Favella taraikaensis, Strain Fe Narragansett Bay" /NCGR_SAMPLE_ID=MMETSP0434 /ASSEMBLY_ACC=CAM_ASM_000379 /LENGTH=262 /DNA_ID=CAMNT_0028198845 /DNA_START=61 /DNA_END=849 /DNA_ORIENTATION=+
MAGNVKGHAYYEIPKEIKYRYPAPGSAPLDRVDHPNLFKKHWKTPFRHSPYNIRMKEKTYGAENAEQFVPELPTLDPSKSEFERLASLQQLPDLEGLELTEPEGTAGDSQDNLNEIWAEQEAEADKIRLMTRDYAQGHWDLDEEYDQVTFIVGGYDKDYSGISNDWRMRQLVTEYEYWIEDVIGEKRIREQKFKMYKGTVKKWQVLDDDAHSRDQIELLQAAVQAPLPEELEMYREKHDKYFVGEVNNENCRLWRDDPLPTD